MLMHILNMVKCPFQHGMPAAKYRGAIWRRRQFGGKLLTNKYSAVGAIDQ